MLRTLTVSACVIAVGVSIGFSPGPQQPSNGQSNQSATNASATPVTPETRPIQGSGAEPNTRQEQQPKPEYLGGWVTKENAPDWIMIFVTLGGFFFAWWQIKEAKLAVRLTERADVLVSGIAIKPTPIAPSTEIKVFFKNYGSTRAHDAKLEAWLLYAHITEPYGGDMPTMVLGAGEEHPIKFHPLNSSMNETTARAINEGRDTLRFIAKASYTDVFGKPHTSQTEGFYVPGRGSFQMTKNEAD